MGKVINFIRVASEIVSALWAITGSLTQAMGIASSLNKDWQIFAAIVVFIILAFWRMYENNLRIKPNLKVVNRRSELVEVNTKKKEVVNTTNAPILNMRHISVLPHGATDAYWDEIKASPYYFALVDYVNNPEVRVEQATAKKVIAVLRYYNEDGEPLIDGKEIIGRWWDEPEKYFLDKSKPPHTLQEIDISPSGKKTRTLVIAMKHKEESIFFAYNMDSTDYDEWRKKEYFLGVGKKYIEVTLAGENVADFTRWFSVDEISDRQMKIEEIDKPNLIKHLNEKTT